MTLNTNDSNGLPVCKKCGWAMAGPYEIERHRSACSEVDAGASATALADRFPDLPSTKFGYGTGMLTFVPDDALHVQLQCSRNKTFQLRDVWLLDDLTADETAALVKAIADWRSACIRARNR